MLGKTEEATRRRKAGRGISINNGLEIDKTIMCKCHNKNVLKNVLGYLLSRSCIFHSVFVNMDYKRFL